MDSHEDQRAIILEYNLIQSLENQYMPITTIDQVVTRISLCNHQNINMYFIKGSHGIIHLPLTWVVHAITID